MNIDFHALKVIIKVSFWKIDLFRVEKTQGLAGIHNLKSQKISGADFTKRLESVFWLKSNTKR